MLRTTIASFTLLCLAFASAPADAARPRQQILDHDVLTLMPEESIWYLTLLRGLGGEALLLDQSDATPMRVTPLGFTAPLGSGKGSYTATPGGSVWAAFSSTHGIRIYDLGDIEQPGPLAPALLQAEFLPSGIDPRATQMGIIAILIGLVAEPRPALSLSFVQDGTSNTVMFGWRGSAFEPVVEVGDGTWTWERPH